ncbi:hypothetical protein QJQ45_013828 [Haematococcus lacustris]|nr:hypothetical protein QJQ45_013828 [Haematococcus lacustris]
MRQWSSWTPRFGVFNGCMWLLQDALCSYSCRPCLNILNPSCPTYSLVFCSTLNRPGQTAPNCRIALANVVANRAFCADCYNWTKYVFICVAGLAHCVVICRVLVG